METYSKEGNSLIEETPLPNKRGIFELDQIERNIAEKEIDISKLQSELRTWQKRKTEAEKLGIKIINEI